MSLLSKLSHCINESRLQENREIFTEIYNQRLTENEIREFRKVIEIK